MFSQQPIIHEMACQRCPAPPCSSPPRKCDYPKQSSCSCCTVARTVAHRPTHVHTQRTHMQVGCMQAILQGGTCKVELRAIRIARSLCLGWLGFGLLARLWLVRCARCMILTSSHGMQLANQALSCACVHCAEGRGFMTFLPAVLLEYNMLVWACVFMQSKKVCGSFVGAISDSQEEGGVCVRARAASSGRQVAPVANVRHSLGKVCENRGPWRLLLWTHSAT